MTEEQKQPTTDTRQGGLRLSMSWKLIIPFIVVILVTLTMLLPLANQTIQQILEVETDQRLVQTAISFAGLLEDKESESQLVASFVANLEGVEAVDGDRVAAAAVLSPLKEELGVQELSYYAKDYQAGGFALYYGGLIIARRNVVSQHTIDIRDGLIAETISTALPTSGIAISPGSSQIIGVAPIIVDDEINGVIMAVFVINEAYVQAIGAILNIDAAIVKDNAPISSTIDLTSGYELMLQEGFIDSSVEFTSETVQYSDGINRRLLSYELVLDGQQQGHVLVAHPLQNSVELQAQIQNIIIGFVGALVFVVLIYSLAVIFNFALPLGRLVTATEKVRAGDFTQRVKQGTTVMRDEVYDLNVNFNAMTADLQQMYSGLEQKVASRTEELSEALKELAIRRDEALEASQTKSLFLANMSHELRTPLNAIIGYSEMLEEEAEDFGYTDIVPDLLKIQKAGTHLLSLINDILDLSKIEAGKVDIYTEDFDFETLLDEIAVTIHPLIQDKGNELIVDSSEPIGTIHNDMTKMRQIVFNLLSNAAKFTENGSITIGIKAEMVGGKEWLDIAVTDTGIGMNPQQVASVFDEFTQADSSTTRKYGGTGLGLPISRHFSQMIGGDISVTSEEGVGSTFKVRIPSDFVQNQSDEDVIVTTAKQSDRLRTTELMRVIGNTTVLVIDDDVVVHDLLNRILSREGFNVVVANTGDEGLLIAHNIKPNIIVLDVMMPTMDGWAVLSKLKDDEALKDIPVVMLSMVDNQSLGFALGATDYLTKPVERDKLVSVLRQHHVRSPQGPTKLLVVEDDEATREIFERTAIREGWEVQTAENGRVGLSRLAVQTPDLILLDLMMPEMDGMQFVAEMRSNEAWQHIPIIVVTAKTLTEKDYTQLRGQVETIVQKAEYTPKHLVTEIRNILAIRQ
jgi:signal transduction histidine kinase/DNA-binding response OmpR family regulator